jgi:hypothetical protein
MHEVLVREIDDLVAVAERLSRDASRAPTFLGPDRVEELSSVTARCGQIIQRIYGDGSHYEQRLRDVLATRNFADMHANYCRHVSQLAGLLKGVQHDLKSGVLDNVRQLLRAEIFVDFLEMAEHLLDEGYKDASAVLLGAVLEDSLRKIAVTHGVSIVGGQGKPLTMDPLNVSIAKAAVYGPLVQKQVTSWANLRNDAAHGHFAKYDAAQVKQFLDLVQKFCADYLR